jgi:hypothetical protein
MVRTPRELFLPYGTLHRVHKIRGSPRRLPVPVSSRNLMVIELFDRDPFSRLHSVRAS